jgi:hypothetical protein
MKKSGHRLETSKETPWSRSRQSKLQYPADPELSGDGTLFKKNSFTNKWCIACSINTWEKSCANNPHKTYKLTKEEQDKATSYMRCTKCGLHVCNICAQLFSQKWLSLTKRQNTIPAWCQLVDSFFSKASDEKVGYILDISCRECFSCHHKHGLESLPPQSASTEIIPATMRRHPRQSQKKRHKGLDKYRPLAKKPSGPPMLDGSLFFPDIGFLSNQICNILTPYGTVKN